MSRIKRFVFHDDPPLPREASGEDATSLSLSFPIEYTSLLTWSVT